MVETFYKQLTLLTINRKNSRIKWFLFARTFKIIHISITSQQSNSPSGMLFSSDSDSDKSSSTSISARDETWFIDEIPLNKKLVFHFLFPIYPVLVLTSSLVECARTLPPCRWGSMGFSEKQSSCFFSCSPAA